jgi:BirA family biotin operon repressor/biotin-[acetyl-CoA-carboxylase] ligase
VTAPVLLELLKDGAFHSGDELGEVLGVSRAAIWKKIHKLEELGLVISSVRGKGYRLQSSIELLDKSILKESLSSTIDEIEVLFDTGSTNSWLLDRANDWFGKTALCVAERQSAGRGRRGREWVSPLGRNLYFSLMLPAYSPMSVIEGLSLIVGLVTARKLRSLGCNASLKWPNDVLVNGQKIAGVLIELHGDLHSECQLIIGVGVNFDLGDIKIDQPATDIRSQIGRVPSRNEFSIALAQDIMAEVEVLKENGLKAFLDEWKKLDYYRDKPVKMIVGHNTCRGIAQGINSKGEFQVMTDKGLKLFNAGEISLRSDNDH